MNSSEKLLALVVLTVLPFAAIAAGEQESQCRPTTHTEVPLRAETIYSETRKVLLDSGWQPIQTVRWQDVDEKLDSDAKVRWRNGQREVEWCVMSSGECRFLFKDIYNNHLRVTTVGEGEYARVSEFEFTCAP